MIRVCVPVLKRYDLLSNMVASLREECTIHVIDNGEDYERVTLAMESARWHFEVYHPSVPLGLAESWNWFIDNVPEDRIITNDDVLFAADSLQRIVETPGDFVSPLYGQAYSCFLIRDSCVEKIGRFDEAISPGYAYFEDCDYSERMDEAGFCITHVEAGVMHLQSQTTAKNTAQEWEDHHRKFLIAQGNFIKKWGRMPPGKEQQF